MHPARPTQTLLDLPSRSADSIARFIQMIVLMLLASLAMAASVLEGLDPDPEPHALGCLLAGGFDPQQLKISTSASNLAILNRSEAHYDCVAEHVSLPPIWIGPLGVLLVVGAAWILFLILPIWRTRRGHVAVLPEHDTAIRDQIEELAERVGLRTTPKIVIDLVEPTIGAVVFGSNRKPVIRINGAAIRERQSQPKVFEAVLLHEMAHIRNRDITLTYASVALWRVFVVLVIIPYLITQSIALPNVAQGLAPDLVPLLLANLSLGIILVFMTYLARLEVLRRRELDADQVAIESGADPRALGKLTEQTNRHRLLRWLGQVWQTHPSPRSRYAVLSDHAMLYRPRPLMLVLSGAAAMLITDQVPREMLHFLKVPTTWTDLFLVAPAVALVTIVVGSSLWNAAIHAVLHDRAAPTGATEGCWLGAGLVLGQFVSVNDGFHIQWLPDYPPVYLILVPMATAFTCWVSQSARIWTERWPGKRIGPIMLGNLIGSGILLGVALTWWIKGGLGFTFGDMTDIIFIERSLMEERSSDLSDSYGQVLSAISSIAVFFRTLHLVPLTWTALGVLLLPLLAWSVPGGDGERPWTARFGQMRPKATTDLIPPRRLTGAVVLGALVAFAAILTVRDLMAPWAPAFIDDAGGLHLKVHSTGIVTAVALGAMAAAMVASALAGRYRLLFAVISAQLAAWMSLSMAFALNMADGCLGSLNVFRDTCGLTPGAAVNLFNTDALPCLVLAAIVGFAGAALVGGIQRMLRRFPSRRLIRLCPLTRAAAVRRVRVWGVVAVCVPIAGIAIRSETVAATETDSGIIDVEVAELVAADRYAPASPEVQALQIYSWLEYGGFELVDGLYKNLYEDRNYLDSALATLPFTVVEGPILSENLEIVGFETGIEHRPIIEDLDWQRLETYCALIGEHVTDARRYFAIPNAEAQVLWDESLEQVGSGVQICLEAIEIRDRSKLPDALDEFILALPLLTDTVHLIEVLQAG
ncbi:M48 family metallopeptidase [Glycomyces sp. YM15]|uniref:M48 family metallopeptidase n=1 Tax=Glycomyces sp. YM15 TaxID=2800446 RepID=UPI00196624DD|nr:M48 family metalloprotease [Glycomyces sp. YM15]